MAFVFLKNPICFFGLFAFSRANICILLILAFTPALPLSNYINSISNFVYSHDQKM